MCIHEYYWRLWWRFRPIEECKSRATHQTQTSIAECGYGVLRPPLTLTMSRSSTLYSDQRPDRPLLLIPSPPLPARNHPPARMSGRPLIPATLGTPEEVNQIIHRHRKVRYGTACYPCRQRKVKCDNKLPCDNCDKRGYAQLCSYNPKDAASNPEANVNGANHATGSDVKSSAGRKRVRRSESCDEAGGKGSQMSGTETPTHWKLPSISHSGA